jgi:hypothetical protein
VSDVVYRVQDGDLVYSIDEERYDHTEISDALDAIYCDLLPDELFVGQIFEIFQAPAVLFTPASFIPNLAERVLDEVGENAYDRVGELADHWIEKLRSPGKEAIDALQQSMEAALTLFGQAIPKPNFYGVDDHKVEKIFVKVLSEDMDYEIVQDPQVDLELDKIFQFVDKHRLEASVINHQLKHYDIDQAHSTLLIGWISATNSMKANLPARPYFIERVRGVLNARHGEAEAKKMLGETE